MEFTNKKKQVKHTITKRQKPSCSREIQSGHLSHQKYCYYFSRFFLFLFIHSLYLVCFIFCFVLVGFSLVSHRDLSHVAIICLFTSFAYLAFMITVIF